MHSDNKLARRRMHIMIAGECIVKVESVPLIMQCHVTNSQHIISNCYWPMNAEVENVRKRSCKLLHAFPNYTVFTHAWPRAMKLATWRKCKSQMKTVPSQASTHWVAGECILSRRRRQPSGCRRKPLNRRRMCWSYFKLTMHAVQQTNGSKAIWELVTCTRTNTALHKQF